MNKTQKMLFIAVLAVILGCLILAGVALFGDISIGKLLEEWPAYYRNPFLWVQEVQESSQQPEEPIEAEGQKLTNGVTDFDNDITCLELQDLFCDLNITTGSSDALSVECQGLEQSVQAVEDADGTLHLRGSSDQEIHDITDLNKLFELLQKGVGRVNISLPRDWNGDIIINSFVGELNVTDVTGRSLQAKVNVGSLELERLRADEVSLSVDAGDVELDAVEADALQARVSVGNVEGRLRGTPADYTIKASTDVGDCELPPSGSGPHMLDIQVSVGSIEIDFD